MKERSAVRLSVRAVFCLVFAGLFSHTNQRPLCTSSTQCEDNSLSFGDERPQPYDHLYVRALDDPDVMKRLLEAIVIQHKSTAYTTGNAVDYEENSKRRPLIGLDVNENLNSSSTERPSTIRKAAQQKQMESKSIDEDAPNSEHENSTERPATAGSLPEIEQAPISSENDDSPWEVTTIEPQQLVSPLTVEEYHFEATTIQPDHGAELISSENSVGQIESSTDKKKDLPPLDATPTKFLKKKTKRPLLHPTRAPPVKSHEKIKGKLTTMLKPPVTVAKSQEQAGEIQSLPRKDPIRITKPPAGPLVMRNTTATSKRPDGKPINIIPKPVNKVGHGKTEASASQSQGTGISNPAANPVAVASKKPEDYLISMLASIAGVEDTDEDEDDEDEEDDKQKKNEEENSNSDSDSDSEEEDSSAEENEERENYEYIDPRVASDVISRVMEEVSALI